MANQTFKGLSLKRWRQFEDIDLDLSSNLCVLTGPNGSGKSTLLQIVAGILQTTTGTAKTNGRVAALVSSNRSIPLVSERPFVKVKDNQLVGVRFVLV